MMVMIVSKLYTSPLNMQDWPDGFADLVHRHLLRSVDAQPPLGIDACRMSVYLDSRLVSGHGVTFLRGQDRNHRLGVNSASQTVRFSAGIHWPI